MRALFAWAVDDELSRDGPDGRREEREAPWPADSTLGPRTEIDRFEAGGRSARVSGWRSLSSSIPAFAAATRAVSGASTSAMAYPIAPRRPATSRDPDPARTGARRSTRRRPATWPSSHRDTARPMRRSRFGNWFRRRVQRGRRSRLRSRASQGWRDARGGERRDRRAARSHLRLARTARWRALHDRPTESASPREAIGKLARNET